MTDLKETKAMTQNRIAVLLELIAELVHGPGTWQEKRDSILEECSSDDKSNIEELATWFEHD